MTATWTLQVWGHSCVSVTAAEPSQAPVRVLLDPGNLTAPLEGVGPVDAVLVTHAHPDHLDADQVRRVDASGSVAVYGPAAVVEQLATAGIGSGAAVDAGRLQVGTVTVDVIPAPHEVIHPELPLPENVAFHIGGRVLAPGDAFLVPSFDVDTLLLPAGAPWLKLSETIEYLRAVAPRRAVLVHGAGLAVPHRVLARTLITKLAPAGTTVVDPAVGEPLPLAD